MKKIFLTVPLVALAFLAWPESVVAQHGGRVDFGGLHGSRSFHGGEFHGHGVRFSPGVVSFPSGFRDGGFHGHSSWYGGWGWGGWGGWEWSWGFGVGFGWPYWPG